MKPAIMKNFSFSSKYFSPINFEALKKDFEFEQTIHWALRIGQYMLDLYLELDEKATGLQNAISTEINELHG